MKDLRFSDLLELYGRMLTQKQLAIAGQYYDMDYSLAEIAENEGISRQAVHASLKQTQSALSELEEKLGFYERNRQIQSKLEQARDINDADALRKVLSDIEEIL